LAPENQPISTLLFPFEWQFREAIARVSQPQTFIKSVVVSPALPRRETNERRNKEPPDPEGGEAASGSKATGRHKKDTSIAGFFLQVTYRKLLSLSGFPNRNRSIS
jgi:hypothetical protein